MNQARTCLGMMVTLFLVVCGASVRADEFTIQSFGADGQIVFSAVQGATNYQIETMPTLTGRWAVAVESIPPTAGNSLTTTVSLAHSLAFFRVMAHTNAESQSGGLFLVVDLSGGPSAASYPVSYLSEAPAGGWTQEYKTTKLVLRRIPATAPSFIMGSPTDEMGRSTVVDETQHEVILSSDFYIGVFEVTQRQWELVMGTKPSFFANATYYQSRPVERVSYYDIRENTNNTAISPHWPESSQVHSNSFMGKLRAKTGLPSFDLPTESQWEYACRAGTTTALNSGHNLTDVGQDTHMDVLGRYAFNSDSDIDANVATNAGTALVGTYLPNAWGLYDMHGNVLEWCLDWYGNYPAGPVTDPKGRTSSTASFRKCRSGAWYNGASECRSAAGSYGYPNARDGSIGLRCSCAVPSQP